MQRVRASLFAEPHAMEILEKMISQLGLYFTTPLQYVRQD
jgi:hypothetical protein